MVTKTRSWVPPLSVDVGDDEWLGIDLVVDGELVEEAEGGDGDVGGGEEGLVGVGAGAGVVVVLGEDVDLGVGDGADEGQEEGRIESHGFDGKGLLVVAVSFA